MSGEQVTSKDLLKLVERWADVAAECGEWTHGDDEVWALLQKRLTDEPSASREPSGPIQRTAVAAALEHADGKQFHESADAVAMKRLAIEVRRLRDALPPPATPTDYWRCECGCSNYYVGTRLVCPVSGENRPALTKTGSAT